MEKINIAELLKDCPKGMELDCTMFENVTFVRVDRGRRQFPIEIEISGLHSKYLTKEGCFYNSTLLPESKCVIFPKGKTTWEGFVPPCKFKDGDILYAIDDGNEYIFIFKHIFEHGRVYCYLSLKGDDLRIQEVWLTDYNTTHRLATEEEKQKLFDSIKANGYRWNAETKTLEKLINRNKFVIGATITNGKRTCKIRLRGVDSYILEDGTYVFFNEVHNWELAPNKFDINTLKVFESRVLVRNRKDENWRPAMFGGIKKEGGVPYVTVGGLCFIYLIPYEGNEHLIGTTNDCDDFFKTWE